jgi:hypothetical protein
MTGTPSAFAVADSNYFGEGEAVAIVKTPRKRGP